MLDFRVETFLCVCKHMNYTKAAEELNITQPAVSQHIKYLEQYYQAPLFIYENKKLHLTSAGKILYNRLETLCNDEKMLKQEIQTSSSDISSLSIGVTMTVGEYALIVPLAEFLKNHPNINVHIHFGNTQDLLKMMEYGEINLALVEGYYPKEEYEHVNYSIEQYVAICAIHHEFKHGTPKKLRDLLGERLLIREKGSGTRNILERNLEAKGISLSEFVHFTEVENMHTIIGLLEKDCGISFLYRIAAEKQIQNQRLKEIKLSDFQMEHEFDFIWEKKSAYSDKFYEICKELISYK
ncbi:MAG: LysR family transcriptional regulator [Lachnospiraceae bacterium]|nr:LysR family transcriptional regulator [Lachnospiraceae bacterium]